MANMALSRLLRRLLRLSAALSLLGPAGARAFAAAPASPPPPVPFSAAVNGATLTLRLTGAFSAAPHTVRLSYFSALNGAPLGSGTFQAAAAGGVIALAPPFKAAPGVYRIEAAVDGLPFASAPLFIPGVERVGGDLYIDGQPFSGFFWTWRPLDYVIRRDGGRYSNLNVANLMRPVAAGGFGFNCIFTDNLWLLKPGDFAYLDKVGGHVCVQTTAWAGLRAWGPASWNAGFNLDPIILSNGSATPFASFDSAKNRANFVHDLQCFKKEFGNPASLLGFYMFESTPDMPWATNSLYSDYSPPSKARFRQWLSTRFGSIARFNALRHAHLPSFDAVEPPATPQDCAARGFDPAFWNDWIDFRYWDMADFLGWARGQIQALFGADKMLITVEGLTSSYTGNDSNVTGANSYCAIDERQRARQTDAIGVEGDSDYMPNHVRVLRRATDFNRDGLPDIPILMDYFNYSFHPEEYGEPADIPHLRFVDELGEGATGGILEHTGEWLVRWEENAPHSTVQWLDGFRRIGLINEVRSRYPGLFAQARVPHDISVVIPVWQMRYEAGYRGEARLGELDAEAFQHGLQRSQREIQMLYADEPLPPRENALMVPIGYRTSLDFVRRLEAAVKQGARVYIEGVPLRDESGHTIPFPLGELVGATVAPEYLTDFNSPCGGALHSLVAWKLENVEDDEVLARFADGAPAIVRHRYFKGEVIYCPSPVGIDATWSAWHGADWQVNFPEAARAYYAGIASMLSHPIATLSGAAAPSELRVHILDGPHTRLVLITNWSTTAQDFRLQLQPPAGVAADLRARKLLAITPSPGQTAMQLHIEAHDWAAIALAPTPAALEAGMEDARASFEVGAR